MVGSLAAFPLLHIALIVMWSLYYTDHKRHAISTCFDNTVFLIVGCCVTDAMALLEKSGVDSASIHDESDNAFNRNEAADSAP